MCFTGRVVHRRDLLSPLWGQNGAKDFEYVFTQHGGMAIKVLIESRAQNTGENSRFAYEQLVKENVMTERPTIQIVTKPFMERRAKATFEVQWPAAWTIFFSYLTCHFLDNYPDQEAIVHVMVGNFRRILMYPEFGY